MSQSGPPTHFYRFLDPAGAKATLANRSLRFKAARTFNDPLDLRVGELVPQPLESFYNAVPGAFYDFLASNVPLEQIKPTLRVIYAVLAQGVRNAAKLGKINSREEFLRQFGDSLYNKANLEGIMSESIAAIQRQLDTCGVACFSAVNNRHDMWGNYADKHRGAALEFSPVSHDSIFGICREVIYSDKRPRLYENAATFVEQYFSAKEDVAASFLFRLIDTKSCNWQQEREYRLVIPGLVSPTVDHLDVKWHAVDLTAIYIGSQATETEASEYLNAGKAVNSEASVYQAKLPSSGYELSFQRLG